MSLLFYKNLRVFYFIYVMLQNWCFKNYISIFVVGTFNFLGKIVFLIFHFIFNFEFCPPIKLLTNFIFVFHQITQSWSFNPQLDLLQMNVDCHVLRFYWMMIVTCYVLIGWMSQHDTWPSTLFCNSPHSIVGWGTTLRDLIKYENKIRK